MSRSSQMRVTARAGRTGGRAATVGLGPRAGSIDIHRASSSHTRRRSRGTRSSHSSRSVGTPAAQEADHPEEPSYEPSEEYTPRTPTRAELREEMFNLHGEIAELRDDLERSRETTARVRRLMDHLQRAHDERLQAMNVLTEKNDAIRDVNHTLTWQYVAAEGERRIATRSLRTRLGDRVRYYRGAASEYAGLVRGYFMSWAQQYQQGPSLGFLWGYRLERSYEETMRDSYYPSDME